MLGLGLGLGLRLEHRLGLNLDRSLVLRGRHEIGEEHAFGLGRRNRSGCRSGAGVRLVDHLLKLAIRRNDELEVRFELAAQTLERDLVGRIPDGDHELSVLVEQRKRDLAPCIFLGERSERLVLDVAQIDVDERKALLPGQHPAKISLVEPTALEQHLAEALSGAHAFLKRAFELLLAEEPGAEDQRSERHVDHRRVGRGHWSGSGCRRRLLRLGKRVCRFC